jgi:hypothetical protein
MKLFGALLNDMLQRRKNEAWPKKAETKQSHQNKIDSGKMILSRKEDKNELGHKFKQ